MEKNKRWGRKDSTGDVGEKERILSIKRQEGTWEPWEGGGVIQGRASPRRKRAGHHPRTMRDQSWKFMENLSKRRGRESAGPSPRLLTHSSKDHPFSRMLVEVRGYGVRGVRGKKREKSLSISVN